MKIVKIKSQLIRLRLSDGFEVFRKLHPGVGFVAADVDRGDIDGAGTDADEVDGVGFDRAETVSFDQIFGQIATHPKTSDHFTIGVVAPKCRFESAGETVVMGDFDHFGKVDILDFQGSGRGGFGVGDRGAEEPGFVVGVDGECGIRVGGQLGGDRGEQTCGQNSCENGCENSCENGCENGGQTVDDGFLGG